MPDIAAADCRHVVVMARHAREQQGIQGLFFVG